MIDFSAVRLGRAFVRHDPKRLMAAHQLLETLAPAPPAVDNTSGVASWGMMLNDQLGCCTIAGLGHSQQVATLNTDGEVTPGDSVILAGYEKYCGYIQGNPKTDNGGNELDILARIQQDGFGGMKLLGYVSPDPANLDHVRKAISYFGSVYMGAEMPLSAQQAGTWDVGSGSSAVAGSWGGHCMVTAKYDPSTFDFITWGENQAATVNWWLKYPDECHVLVWDCWVKKFPAATQQMILSMLGELD